MEGQIPPFERLPSGPGQIPGKCVNLDLCWSIPISALTEMPAPLFDVRVHKRVSHLKVIPTTKNARPNRPSKIREIRELGHVIQTGNQMTNTANRTSKEIKTQRLGRASGLSRWYSLPQRRMVIESTTAENPNPTKRLKTMIVPACERITLYLITEPVQLSNSEQGGY
jgi:hypothetical protein